MPLQSLSQRMSGNGLIYSQLQFNRYSTLYLPVTLYVITQACIIVCDVTRRDTMNNVSIWKNDVDTKCGDIPILLLANKVKDKSYFKGMHKGLFF